MGTSIIRLTRARPLVWNVHGLVEPNGIFCDYRQENGRLEILKDFSDQLDRKQVYHFLGEGQSQITKIVRDSFIVTTFFFAEARLSKWSRGFK